MNRVLLASFGLALLTTISSGCNTSTPPPPVKTAKQGHAQHSPEHSHAGHDMHGAPTEEPHLIVTTQPATAEAGQEATLRLMVHAGAAMISEFEETHTKLAHLIIVRNGLDEFAHLHPEVDERGNMTVKHVFPAGGVYRLFLDHKPKGAPAATAKATLEVSGKVPPAPQLKANVPGKVTAESVQATVSLRKQGDASIVAFELADESGEAIADLMPYLGAMGHLVAISADGERYAHSHPLTDDPGESRVEFEVHFPGPGTYKLWGQFQRSEGVITIPAVIEIADVAHVP